MKVVFRVDASFQVGAGHLMRCLTLAEALRERGVDIYIICRECPGNLIAMLRQKAIPVRVMKPEDHTENLGEIQAEDADQTIGAINGESTDWLVVDHYGLDAVWENKLRPHVKNLMVIDDLANRPHVCEILLDQNFVASGDVRYKNLVTPLCKVLLGPKYALLRKEFKMLRENLEPRVREMRKILVFFTSGDDQGETLKAMQGIELSGKDVHVDVVVGLTNPGNEEISEKCTERNWDFHRQVDYMPRLIAEADIVIGAGGSSNWERCALGVPALVAILAENQLPIAEALDSAGIVVNLGWWSNLQATDYANALNALTHEALNSMSDKAFKLVDAEGADRAVEMLLAA